jgi:hypothetical protein
VVVKNTGSVATTAWQVKWTFANGQVITSLWQGIYTQTGANVTVNNETYNGSLSPGQTASFGFNGNSGTTNAVPVTTCTAT